MTFTKSTKFNKLLLTTFLISSLSISLSACSNKPKESKPKTIQTLNQQQIIETGTVISTKTIQIKPTPVSSHSNIGIAASSGGFRGIHGSIDLGTLSRLFKKPESPLMGQEIIVKKKSGQIIAITQSSKETFKQGDVVKILLRDGNAQVIH